VTAAAVAAIASAIALTDLTAFFLVKTGAPQLPAIGQPLAALGAVSAAVAFARMHVMLNMRHSPLAYPPAIEESPNMPAVPASSLAAKSAGKAMQAPAPHR